MIEGTQVTWLATMGDWAYIEEPEGLIRGFVQAETLEPEDQ